MYYYDRTKKTKRQDIYRSSKDIASCRRKWELCWHPVGPYLKGRQGDRSIEEERAEEEVRECDARKIY